MKYTSITSTFLIVEKDKYYMVGCDLNGNLRWSRSVYDAWRTKDRMSAYRVAWSVGGSVLLFNPIVGKTKSLKGRTVTDNEEVV